MHNDFSKLKFGLYARKSSERDDRQVQSIDDQINAMTAKAGHDNIKILETFSESRSAKKPDNRPEFARMIKQIRAGNINAVICWQINRLTRNPTDSGILQQLLQDEVIQCIVTNDRVYLPSDNEL